ncbi:hypothetical protein [Nostoc sp.]|uniref:hypothetical protein n=1 Tax=Nostoc sp. TaxID=1180 RepID=UPI002FF4DD4A
MWEDEEEIWLPTLKSQLNHWFALNKRAIRPCTKGGGSSLQAIAVSAMYYTKIISLTI